MLGTLKEMSEHLEAHGIQEWAEKFRRHLSDYLAARGTAQQSSRQMAVVEHILTEFGGHSDFRQLKLTDETGATLQEANETLESLSSNLWSAARSTQAYLHSELRSN